MIIQLDIAILYLRLTLEAAEPSIAYVLANSLSLQALREHIRSLHGATQQGLAAQRPSLGDVVVLSTSLLLLLGRGYLVVRRRGRSLKLLCPRRLLRAELVRVLAPA